MKLNRLLLVIAFLSATLAVNAQNSHLNGQQYTIVMVDEQNHGDEIIDILSFENNQLVTQNLTKDGYAGSQFSENGNNFEVVLSNAAGESMSISGTTEDKTIYGNIVSTKNGQTYNFVFRGMTTIEWNRIRQLKEDASN